MKYTVSLMPVSILIWGWLNGTWIAATILLLITGSSLLTQWRWQLSIRQFHRIGDFITLLVIATLIYFYTIQISERPIFIILKWLPVYFAPVLFAQLFSTRQSLPPGTLFYSMRKQSESEVTGIDFRIPFSGLCILAAGAANDQTPVYFVTSVFIVIWILWTVRIKHITLIIWLLVISSAAATSFWGHQALHRFQAVIEKQAIDWLSDWVPDPFKSQTSIGDIGDLKLSDRIEFRVKTQSPLLLHEASYDRYAGKSWYASRRTFKHKAVDNPSVTTDTKQLEILQTFRHQAILALPAGTVKIKGLEGADILYNPLGAVKISDAPEFADYQVFYTGRHTSDLTKLDLEIPGQHSAWLDQIATQLKLQELSPLQAAQAIKQFFRTHYFYSLYLGKQGDADQALKDFMLNRKAGHCEYFAVASVLLLRYAGIPARLATGYSVQEYDPYEKLYLVRRRHAHAWAMAHIDGYWINVDSTPSQWLDIEDQNASWLQPINDWFSNLAFQFKQWRWHQTDKEKNTSILIGGIILLIIYVSWRLYSNRSQMVRTDKNRPDDTAPRLHLGMDSEFYLIEESLHNTELGRHKNESLQHWGRRISEPGLNRILQMHYRYRFDPAGITEVQREELRQSTFLWLEGKKDPAQF